MKFRYICYIACFRVCDTLEWGSRILVRASIKVQNFAYRFR
jgi:hypothetical protein